MKCGNIIILETFFNERNDKTDYGASGINDGHRLQKWGYDAFQEIT